MLKRSEYVVMSLSFVFMLAIFLVMYLIHPLMLQMLKSLIRIILSSQETMIRYVKMSSWLSITQRRAIGYRIPPMSSTPTTLRT